MRANRSRFAKLLLQWEIQKYSLGVIKGDEAVGEILSNERPITEQDLRTTPIAEDIERNEEFKKLMDKGYEIFFTTEKAEYDAFGNAKHYSPKELLKEQMDELSALGKTLLEEEKYELLAECKQLYDKVKKEYDRL